MVVMPDMFDNDPAPNSTATAEEEENATIIEQIKIGAVTAVKAFQIDMWLARHTAEKVMPILLKVIEAAKLEFADAIAGGGGMYCVGYCFGAKYCLILGAEKPEAVRHFIIYLQRLQYPVLFTNFFCILYERLIIESHFRLLSHGLRNPPTKKPVSSRTARISKPALSRMVPSSLKMISTV